MKNQHLVGGIKEEKLPVQKKLVKALSSCESLSQHNHDQERMGRSRWSDRKMCNELYSI